MTPALRASLFPPYDVAAQALFGRMTGGLRAPRRQLISDTIRRLKLAGVWSRLAGFWIMAAQDTQAAKLNWVSATADLTEVNAPTFVADRGYTGDGSTNYLRTNYSPASPVAQNDMAFGVWVSGGTSQDSIQMGATNAFIYARRASGNLRSRVNSASNVDLAVTAVTGLTAVSRSASGGYARYKNGASLGDATETSSTLAAELGFLARYLGTPSDYSSNTVSAGFIGQSLDAAQMLAVYEAMNTYLMKVGAA